MKKIVVPFNGNGKILLIGWEENFSRLFNMTSKKIFVRWFGQDFDLQPSGVLTRVVLEPSGVAILKGVPEMMDGTLFIVEEDVFLMSYWERQDFIPFTGKKTLIVQV